MVKVKNILEVPVKLVKINAYTLATLQPNEETELSVDPETITIVLTPP